MRLKRDVQIYYQSGTIMVEDKYEEEQWYPSKEFVNSEMLEGWYFEGHYTITDKPKEIRWQNIRKGTQWL